MLAACPKAQANEEDSSDYVCADQNEEEEDGPEEVAAVEVAGATEQTTEGPVVPAAAVLLVEGLVDGNKARVGLDSFAGVSMVTAEAVMSRRNEWRETSVGLQGIAKGVVRPLGEVTVCVKVGDTTLVEQAMVCEHLPGGADVLMSYDALEKAGLTVSKEGVKLGGQKCTVIAATAKAKVEGAKGRGDKGRGGKGQGQGGARHSL